MIEETPDFTEEDDYLDLPAITQRDDFEYTLDYDKAKKILDTIYDTINIFYSSENLSKNILPSISREPAFFVEEIKFILKQFD